MLTVQYGLETETCCNCGVLFAMPASMGRRLRDDGGLFYCPNGHGQRYTEPTVKRLERELAQAKAKLDQAQAANREAEHRASVSAKRELRTKATLKRERFRISKGVCPCCNRTFANLQRHMHTKHPDFATAKEATK